MTTTTRRSSRALLLVPALLSAVVVSAGAQVNSRPIRPAEQAFLDRVASEFAKILPPVPAGWAEVERRIYDAGGMTSDWDAPISADYEVQLVSSELEARQKVVEQREQDAADKNRGAFEAANARWKQHGTVGEVDARLVLAVLLHEVGQGQAADSSIEVDQPCVLVLAPFCDRLDLLEHAIRAVAQEFVRLQRIILEEILRRALLEQFWTETLDLLAPRDIGLRRVPLLRHPVEPVCNGGPPGEFLANRRQRPRVEEDVGHSKDDW